MTRNEKILRGVLAESGVTRDQIFGRRRGLGSKIVKARDLVIRRLFNAGQTTTEIGEFLRRDKSTIWHSLNKSEPSGNDEIRSLTAAIERLEERVRELEKTTVKAVKVVGTVR